MILHMADWEQPSTSVLLKAGAGGSGSESELQVLRVQLETALDRIAVLEQRVTELETRVEALRGRTRRA